MTDFNFSGKSPRDHLGNTRVCFADRNGNGRIELPGEQPAQPDYTEIIQENHYYPFGLELSGPWPPPQSKPDNPYRYNGKEHNPDLGLDWCDYGARWYDPAIARWGQVDPLAGNYHALSPYNFTLDNPLIFLDRDGRAVETLIIGKDKKLDARKRQEILARLQLLTNDKLGVDPETGEVYIALACAANIGRNFSNGTMLIRDLIYDDNKVYIKEGDSNGTNPLDEEGKKIKNELQFESGREYDVVVGFKLGRPTLKVEEDGIKRSRPDYISLGHELAHARDIVQGTSDRTPVTILDPDTGEKTSSRVAEIKARMFENRLRAEHDMLLRKIPEIVNDN